MTDYDKKWAWIFAGAEIAALVIGRILLALAELIPSPEEGLGATGASLLKSGIIPAALIGTAFTVLALYKKNRDGGGGL